MSKPGAVAAHEIRRGPVVLHRADLDARTLILAGMERQEVAKTIGCTTESLETFLERKLAGTPRSSRQ
jgi:hypothetical protein